jgi:hypothetical protein
MARRGNSYSAFEFVHHVQNHLRADQSQVQFLVSLNSDFFRRNATKRPFIAPSLTIPATYLCSPDVFDDAK